jgi:putative transferase (TIGR04331 family)
MEIDQQTQLSEHMTAVATIEEIVSHCLAQQYQKTQLPQEELCFLFRYWVHFFCHSSLAVYFSGDSASFDPSKEFTEVNLKNVPADSAAFMQLNRSNEYVDYLRASLSSAVNHRLPNVNQVLTVVDPSCASKGTVLVYRAGMDKFSRVFLPLSTLGKIRMGKDHLVVDSSPPNVQRRLQIRDALRLVLLDFPFFKWFSSRLVEFLPMIFVEHFYRVAGFYSDNSCAISAIFSTDRWSSDDSLKFLAVFSKGADGKRPLRIGAPHSFNYGALKYFWLRDYEIQNLDHYLTWGWRFKGCDPFYVHKVRPGRRPVPPRSLPYGFEILITGATRPNHLTEFPYTQERYLEYLDHQIELAIGLKSLGKGKVTIRTRQKDRGSSLEERIRHLGIKSVSFEYQSGRFSQRVKNCLHVSDNTSTSIIESLHMNQPTLVVINDSYFELWENAEEDFLKLEQASVFHRTVPSLLSFLSQLDSINRWWAFSFTQNAVTSFLNTQARRSPSARVFKTKLLELSHD